MKTWMKALGFFLIFVPMSVRAGVIFSDDFQEFTNGTVLTETNYTPNVGVSAEVDTNDSPGENTTTVVATNLFGSTRLLFQLGTVPYAAKYQGFPLTGAQTNRELTLSFKLWIPALKATNQFGGFEASVLTTNIDFIDVSGTNYQSEPLIFINDDGKVVTFTNTPSTQTFVTIGNWSNQVNKVMTNVLVVNYPGGTFSFSINGSVLTNMPIPGYASNLYQNVRLEVSEDITNGGNASQGNLFALDDVLLTNNVVFSNADVESFLVVKGQMFTQSLSSVTLESTGWVFHAEVKGFVSNSIVSDTLTDAGLAPQPLTNSDPSTRTLTFDNAFTSQGLLDAAYPNGSYTQNITTLNSGAFVAAVGVTNNTYPTTPQISNLAAAQTIGSTTNFTLTWNTFTGGGTLDFISVDITDTNGNDAFVTPDFDQTNAINGTVTSVVIPGGTLLSSYTYDGVLLFAKRVTANTNDIPGALGIGTYVKETEFSIKTLATTVCVFAISPTNTAFSSAGGPSNITVTAQNGCAWTATTNSAFISITAGSSGSGTGTVTYSVTANTNTVARAGTMTIAGQTATINQAAAACTFTLSGTNANFLVAGGSSNVTVTANGTNCAWTAVSNSAFITITAGTNTTGSGAVAYSVAANSNTLSRSGTMTIAGQTFTVTQAATACSVAPATTNATFTAAGGSSNVVVTANGTNCTWTAVSNNPFIIITAGTNGVGNGTVTYTVAVNSNTVVSLSGTMTIAGETFTVTQPAASCNAAPATTNATFIAAGGSSNVVVTANGTNCTWTAASNSAFITITAGTNGTGSGTVSYSVTANTNTIGRSGTMTVAGQTFTVTQVAAACTFTLSATNAAYANAGGSSNVTVTANGTNCSWTAVSNNAFITITAGTNGTGNGTVDYTVAVNTNTSPRNGTMTIGAQTFTVTQAARPLASDLGITKSGSLDLIEIKSNLTYTITVTNVGPDTAVSVTVTDSLPGGVTFVSAKPRTAKRSGANVIGTLGSLSAGTSTSMIIIVRTPATAAVLTNIATVSSSTQDPNTNNNVASAITTVIVPPIDDLAVFKTNNVPSIVLVGTNFTYTLVVTNLGPNTATGVTLVDRLETNHIGFVSVNNGNCVNSNGVVVCDFGTLNSGAGETVSIVVTGVAPGHVCNTATITGSVVYKVKTNNSSEVCTLIDVNDLATTRLVAPKKIELTSTHTNVLGEVSVTIQNRSTHTESITDTNMFTNLVTLVVSPVGSNDCTTPVPVPKIPKKFPITLKSKQTLTMSYSLTFGCPNAPSGWTNVYQYVATVHHEALAGGIPDMQPPCDVCPRGPLATPGNRDPNPDDTIIDKGCGARGTNGVLGASVLTTVIKK